MAEEKEFNVVIQMLITAENEEDALARAVDDINSTFLTGDLDAYVAEDQVCVVNENGDFVLGG